MDALNLIGPCSRVFISVEFTGQRNNIARSWNSRSRSKRYEIYSDFQIQVKEPQAFVADALWFPRSLRIFVKFCRGDGECGYADDGNHVGNKADRCHTPLEVHATTLPLALSKSAIIAQRIEKAWRRKSARQKVQKSFSGAVTMASQGSWYQSRFQRMWTDHLLTAQWS